jgi:hypothetical protein
MSDLFQTRVGSLPRFPGSPLCFSPRMHQCMETEMERKRQRDDIWVSVNRESYHFNRLKSSEIASQGTKWEMTQGSCKKGADAHENNTFNPDYSNPIWAWCNQKNLSEIQII